MALTLPLLFQKHLHSVQGARKSRGSTPVEGSAKTRRGLPRKYLTDGEANRSADVFLSALHRLHRDRRLHSQRAAGRILPAAVPISLARPSLSIASLPADATCFSSPWNRQNRSSTA